MDLRVAAAVSLLLALATTTGAVTFNATNTATGTIGGLRFDVAVGLDYASLVLSNASAFIWSSAFNQTRPADRKPVDAVTLVVVADVSGARGSLHRRRRHHPQRPVRRQLLRRRENRGRCPSCFDFGLGGQANEWLAS